MGRPSVFDKFWLPITINEDLSVALTRLKVEFWKYSSLKEEFEANFLGFSSMEAEANPLLKFPVLFFSTLHCVRRKIENL